MSSTHTPSDTPNNSPAVGVDSSSDGTLAEPSTPFGSRAWDEPEHVADFGGKDYRYEYRGEAGRGGMGIAYRAWDRVLHREVVVKAIRREFRESPGALARFRTEAQITAQLPHPNIPPIHDSGDLPDGSPFLVMKWIHGSTLADLLKERKNPATDLYRFLDIFEKVCEAVGFAHSQGVIHRDMKPSNVMVGSFGEVQVMDWGLGKKLAEGANAPVNESAVMLALDTQLTRTGDILGTPAYMPPEQATGDVARIDRRADVFALGSMLCEILTGKPPYTGKTSDEVTIRAARWEITDTLRRLGECGAHRDLIELTLRCLTSDPIDRPADAGTVLEAVAEHRKASDLALRQVEATGLTRRTRHQESRRMFRRMVTIVAVVGLLVLLGVAYAQRIIANQEKEQDNFRQLLIDELDRAHGVQLARYPTSLDARKEAHARAKGWLEDPRLQHTRDTEWLAGLRTTKERERWVQFWKDVERLRTATAK